VARSFYQSLAGSTLIRRSFAVCSTREAMGLYGISLGMSVKKTAKRHKDGAVIDAIYIFSFCHTAKLFYTLDFYLFAESHRR
jgi:hypothetical protein